MASEFGYGSLFDMFHQMVTDIWASVYGDEKGSRADAGVPEKVKREMQAQAAKAKAEDTPTSQAAKQEEIENGPAQNTEKTPAADASTNIDSKQSATENQSLFKTVAKAGAECIIPFAASYSCMKEGKYGEALLWGAVDAVSVATFFIPGGQVVAGMATAAKIARAAKTAKTIAKTAKLGKEVGTVAKVAKAGKQVGFLSKLFKRVKSLFAGVKGSKTIVNTTTKAGQTLGKIRTMAVQNEGAIRTFKKFVKPLKKKRENDAKKDVCSAFGRKLYAILNTAEVPPASADQAPAVKNNGVVYKQSSRHTNSYTC